MFETENEMLEKALALTLQAHTGQTDRAGHPYILHPLRLMSKCRTTDEMVICLLHDVVEDSNITINHLRENGFPKHIVSAVEALTRRKMENWDDYIDRVLKNPLSVKIKQLDLQDNMNLLRLDELSEKDLNRMQRYHRAWKKLKNSE